MISCLDLHLQEKVELIEDSHLAAAAKVLFQSLRSPIQKFKGTVELMQGPKPQLQQKILRIFLPLWWVVIFTLSWRLFWVSSQRTHLHLICLSLSLGVILILKRSLQRCASRVSCISLSLSLSLCPCTTPGHSILSVVAAFPYLAMLPPGSVAHIVVWEVPLNTNQLWDLSALGGNWTLPWPVSPHFSNNHLSPPPQSSAVLNFSHALGSLFSSCEILSFSSSFKCSF